MIKINEHKSVDYMNEYDSLIFWEDKKNQWFDFYLLKNNIKRFILDNDKEYKYLDQQENVIKKGIADD